MGDLQPSTPSFATIKTHLVDLGPFLFLANSGNAGDSLIAAATLRLFDELGLEWYYFSEELFEQNQTVVCSGGGALVPYYRHLTEFLGSHFNDFTSVTLLPHSVVGHENLLSRMDSRFTLFAREPVTFDHLKSHATEARINLSHDMAFLLDESRLCLSAGLPLTLPGQATARQLSWLLHRLIIKRAIAKRDENGAVILMRNDIEALESRRTTRFARNDLAALLGAEIETKKQVFGLANIFIAQIKQCPAIVTDRLHIAIAAALCGVPCSLHPNSYFKNEAIYHHSLEPYFENIDFSKKLP